MEPQAEIKNQAYAEYMSKKGQPLVLDGQTFDVHPSLTAAEEVEVWRDDSRILVELVNALLEKAPGFCEWIADQWEARKAIQAHKQEASE